MLLGAAQCPSWQSKFEYYALITVIIIVFGDPYFLLHRVENFKSLLTLTQCIRSCRSAGVGCCRETRLMSVCKWRQAWWARYNNGLMWEGIQYPVPTELCCALRNWDTRPPPAALALCSANIGGAVQRWRLDPGCGPRSQAEVGEIKQKLQRGVTKNQPPPSLLPPAGVLIASSHFLLARMEFRISKKV